MQAKLLLVDDEADILEPLRFNLQRLGFTVELANTGAQAISAINSFKPDIIVLDVMLPDTTGTQLANQLKHNPQTAGIPIILLTARDTETDIVVGLSMGADDYVTKPFSTQVLVARIEAILRRLAAHSGPQLVSGPLRIHTGNLAAYIDGKPIDLTQAEFKILAALMKARGAVLSRDKLMEEFGRDSTVTDRNIDVHIAALRKKIGPAREMIKTVHGLGYRFE